jgi:hypothetical protein
MSNSQVKEPGWEPSEPATPTSTTTSPATDKPKRVRGPRKPNPASNASPSPAPTTTPTTESSPALGSGPARHAPNPADSKVLTEIISQVLAGATSLASIYTKARFGVSARLSDDEAVTIARPVARLIQRRTHIRNDLNDAADGAGALAGALAYFERVAGESRRTDPRPGAAPRPFVAPAVVETAPPRHERVESFVDDSHLEPGSGDFRGTFLTGFDEIRPHE